MSQKQEIKDILKSKNVTLNDISKIEFSYVCTTEAFEDDLGIVMSTIDGMFTVSKEHFNSLINNKLTRDQEADFKRREQYEIEQLIPRVLLNIYMECPDTNRQIKIDRVIRIHAKDTSKPRIRIEKGELDYFITDLDITNKKCRDMLLVIKSIKKDYPNNQIVNISDERIDLLVLYANELSKVEFDNLHREQDEIERYLYELTSALDNQERVALLRKYARFRVWYITYIAKLRNSVKGRV
jgi:hypothetical protein